MLVSIRIIAQYYENYSDTETPYWKPKNSSEFIIKNVESEDILYIGNEKMAAAIEKLLDSTSNVMSKFELRDWELVFSEPSELYVGALYKNLGINQTQND
jgi:hypothetical protein